MIVRPRFAGNSQPATGVLVFPVRVGGTPPESLSLTVLTPHINIDALYSPSQFQTDMETLQQWAAGHGGESVEFITEEENLSASNLLNNNELSQAIVLPSGTPLYRAIVDKRIQQVGFVLVRPVPVPPVVPMGFVLLSQVRWLTSQKVIIYLCAISAAAYVLIVLVDSGVRIKVSQVPFAASSFGRALAWALFVAGMTVVTMAVVHSGSMHDRPDKRNTSRVIDKLRLI